jgi:hypothetical protein
LEEGGAALPAQRTGHPALAAIRTGQDVAVGEYTIKESRIAVAATALIRGEAFYLFVYPNRRAFHLVHGGHDCLRTS